MLSTSFYDPEKSYEYNFSKGPFGAFAGGKVYQNKNEPIYNLFGNPVFLPFGIPPGPLINGKFVKAALDKGFDVVTYKTVRTLRYPCSPWPNVLSVNIKGNLTLDMASGGLKANHTYSDPIAITN